MVAQSSSEVKEGIKFRNEGAAIDEVAIYPVQQFQDIVEIKGEVKYGNQILPLEMTLIVHGPLGQFSKKTHLTGGKGEYTVDFLYGGILWNLKGPQQSVLETPALEYLHSTVAPFARGHAQQLMQRASTGTEAIDAIDRSDLLDEYVVHGLGRAWFEQLNTDWQLGYDMDSLKKQNRVSNWWHDENVDKMARYIAKVSPAAVIRMYQNSPEQLIAESGLKMR
ncbi:MAG: hypothetical protein QGI38_02170 [Candidatus Woesearchaeota archaeon]|nr:hypothetical protein [Candidatus Woesearchaeota archaeon]